MTKRLTETYYYFQEETRTIFYTTEEQDQVHDLIFLGSSMNPNIRMTASVMANQLKYSSGYKIKQMNGSKG